MIDYTQVFNDSHERISAHMDNFFSVFYQCFTNKSDAIRTLFKGIDMHRQQQMLKHSFSFIIPFASSKCASDYLVQLADKHRDQLKVQGQMYDDWVESLIEALQTCDNQFNRDVEMAWRIVLAPGVAFMKHYTCSST